MISAIILTKSEEKNIAECLKTLDWCDEILVIDDYSVDQTMEIAHSLGAKVHKRQLNNDFAAQRNFGLDKAKGEWVLFVDADERVSPNLAEEIQSEVQVGIHLGGGTDTTQDTLGRRGFYIKRRDFFGGKELKHGETGGAKFLRLAAKNAGRWERAVHETWEVEGEISELSSPLYHYPHQTISEFLSDINRYSTLHAQANLKEGKTSSILKVLLWPKLKFLDNWIFKGGFLDGGPGFIGAIMMSFHSYLAWGKLWILQKGK